MRRFPRPRNGVLNALAAAIVAGTALLETSVAESASPEVFLAALVLGLPVAVRRRSAYAAGLALGVASIVWAPLDLPYPSAFFVAIAFVLFSLGAAGDLRRSGPIAVIALIALMASAGVIYDAYVPITLVAAGGFWVGTQAEARRRLTAALEERNREIVDAQREFERLAVRRERARIAGELHDIVSHHLSMVVVQAGAGRMTPHAEPEVARARFAAIRAGGLEALGELANLVDVLEPASDVGSTEAIRALLDRARERGTEVNLDLDALDSLRPETAAVAHRVIQEGLTNALKHGASERSALTIERSSAGLEIELRNGLAPGSALASTGSGSGLAGMRARVAELGGELTVGESAGSFWTLAARLPLTASTEVVADDEYLARMS